MLTNTCTLPTDLRTWRDDTAADFAQAGAVMRDTCVEKAGFVGPVAYATGRVRLSGVMGNTIGTDPATATWASVDAGRTGTSFSPNLAISYGQLAPWGVGLTAIDDVTVLVEGEIQLDATGTWRFELDANDVGFFELAPPGGNFTRVVNSSNAPTSGNFTVATAGWYRFRAAFADSAQYMDFTLRMDSPALPGAYRDITSEQLRARVDDLEGALFDGFDDTYLIGYDGSTVLDTPLQLSLPGDPFGIQVGMLSWSMHAAAQFLIDHEGDYTFAVTSHHGHRMWIDGQQLANSFTSNDATTNTPLVHLVAGWHDLVLDATKSNDSADLVASLTVTSGPDFAGQPFPVDHLRPLPGNVARNAGDSDGSSTTITDGGSITRTLTVQMPPGATPIGNDVNYTFIHTAQAQVGIVLDPPAGSNITFVATGALSGSGTHSGHAVVTAADAGTTWNLIASDSTVDAVTGTLEQFGVTTTYNGGLAPFPTSYRYESAPKELGNVFAIGALSWQTRQGTASKVQFRTCADPSCTGEPWTDVAQSGTVPAVALEPYAQYAVEFTSDGVTPTALDWIELKYSASTPTR